MELIKHLLAKTISGLFLSVLLIAGLILVGIYYVTIYPFVWALNYGLNDREQAGYGNKW